MQERFVLSENLTNISHLFRLVLPWFLYFFDVLPWFLYSSVRKWEQISWCLLTLFRCRVYQKDIWLSNRTEQNFAALSLFDYTSRKVFMCFSGSSLIKTVEQNRFFPFQFWHTGLLLRKAYFFTMNCPNISRPLTPAHFQQIFVSLDFSPHLSDIWVQQIVCFCIWYGWKNKKKLFLSERTERAFHT